MQAAHMFIMKCSESNTFPIVKMKVPEFHDSQLVGISFFICFVVHLSFHNSWFGSMKFVAKAGILAQIYYFIDEFEQKFAHIKYTVLTKLDIQQRDPTFHFCFTHRTFNIEAKTTFYYGMLHLTDNMSMFESKTMSFKLS